MKKQQPASTEPITMAEIDALAASLGITNADLNREDEEIDNLTDEEVILLAQQIAAGHRPSSFQTMR